MSPAGALLVVGMVGAAAYMLTRAKNLAFPEPANPSLGPDGPEYFFPQFAADDGALQTDQFPGEYWSYVDSEEPYVPWEWSDYTPTVAPDPAPAAAPVEFGGWDWAGYEPSKPVLEENSMPLPAPFQAKAETLDSIIDEAAATYGVRAEIIRAIITVESSWNPNAQNPGSSARGLMQITRAAAQDVGVPHEELFDPRTNIMAGAAYLRRMMNQFPGDEAAAVRAYHQGAGNERRGASSPYYRDAQSYQSKVYAYA